MEAMAVKTDGGTYTLAIERMKVGSVARIDLHLSLVPGDDTEGMRVALDNVADLVGSEGDREMQMRLASLTHELWEQDEARKVPATGKGGA